MYRKTNNNVVLLQTVILLLEVAAAVTSRNAEVEAKQRNAREKCHFTWMTWQNTTLNEEWIFGGCRGCKPCTNLQCYISSSEKHLQIPCTSMGICFPGIYVLNIRNEGWYQIFIVYVDIYCDSDTLYIIQGWFQVDEKHQQLLSTESLAGFLGLRP